MDKNRNVPKNVPKNNNVNDLLLRLRLKYSIPKLYEPKDENGRTTLNKRWYVYFYFDNPKTGKRTANDKFIKHHGINRYKTISQRREFGKNLVAEYTKMLSDGWNPHHNTIVVNRSGGFSIETTSLKKAIEMALMAKKRTLKESSYRDVAWRIGRFIDFTIEHRFSEIDTAEFNRLHVQRFLEDRQLHESATSVNNYRTAISSIITEMVREGQVMTNFVRDIPKLKATPIKNHPFTEKQISDIKCFLEKEDLMLLNYIRVLAYSFLRNSEVAALTVGDVNLRYKQITPRDTKTEAVEKIHIIDPLYNLFEKMNLEQYPENYNIFTPENEPAKWNSSLRSKRDYFSKRFRIVKTKFNFGDEYGIYSFRHSFAVHLLDSFMDSGLTYTESVHKMLPITRHKSVQALENYLREKQGMLPKDYTLDLAIDF